MFKLDLIIFWEQGYEHRKESSGKIQIADSLKWFMRQNNSKVLL